MQCAADRFTHVNSLLVKPATSPCVGPISSTLDDVEANT